ncbi:uncharacterized protein [Miscanthus floridulus]|uniref:uncharacterized protein isoform X2 n=1 Tax=Miscanthus floridulus TaxID=154761 RepID=UPI00345A50BF
MWQTSATGGGGPAGRHRHDDLIKNGARIKSGRRHPHTKRDAAEQKHATRSRLILGQTLEKYGDVNGSAFTNGEESCNGGNSAGRHKAIPCWAGQSKPTLHFKLHDCTYYGHTQATVDAGLQIAQGTTVYRETNRI